jgi:hypothetical protein
MMSSNTECSQMGTTAYIYFLFIIAYVWIIFILSKFEIKIYIYILQFSNYSIVRTFHAQFHGVLDGGMTNRRSNTGNHQSNQFTTQREKSWISTYFLFRST